MGKYVIDDETLQRMADITRALTGTNGEMTPMQMVGKLGEIRVRRFDGEYTGEDLNGFGKYLALLTSDELKEHRNDEDLRVTVHFHHKEFVEKTVKMVIAGNLKTLNKGDKDTGSYQKVTRWAESNLLNEAEPNYRLDDDSELSSMCGHTYITQEGELRVYANANGYYIRACKWTVIVEW